MQKSDLNNLQHRALTELKKSRPEQLESWQIKYLGRKGELTAMLRALKDLPTAERAVLGALANEVKKTLDQAYQQAVGQATGLDDGPAIDLTLPGKRPEVGHLHPISQLQYQLEDIFLSLGFIVEDGPELESEFYNFEALNIPANHPARDHQDTFYIKEDKKSEATNRLLMRTQTSPVQIRAMKKYGAPLRLIAPGKVFRNEATDASHEAIFHQIEGLMIDKDISIADLMAVCRSFLRSVFEKDIKLRFRPGFFPFVEPGFELDMGCSFCDGQGCSVCKKTGWIEFMGCGLVHPNVLRAGGLDPEVYSGFAFGFGLERLIMRRYGVNDIRLFNSGDLRFLKQF